MEIIRNYPNTCTYISLHVSLYRRGVPRFHKPACIYTDTSICNRFLIYLLLIDNYSSYVYNYSSLVEHHTICGYTNNYYNMSLYIEKIFLQFKIVSLQLTETSPQITGTSLQVAGTSLQFAGTSL